MPRHRTAPRRTSSWSRLPRYVMAADRCRENLSPSFLAQLAADRIAIECADSNMLVTSQKEHVCAAPRIVVRVRGRLGRARRRWVVLSDERHVRAERRQQSRPHTAGLSYAYGVTITSNTPGAPVIYGDGSRGTFESGTAAINARTIQRRSTRSTSRSAAFRARGRFP